MTSISPSRPYHRTEIDREFLKRKQLMQAEALEHGNGLALYKDCYTGLILRRGERYDYEHIISSEEVFMTCRATHTNEEIALIVNVPENVSTTMRTINQAKGKKCLLQWMTDSEISAHGINKSLALKNHAKAKRAIEQKAKALL